MYFYSLGMGFIFFYFLFSNEAFTEYFLSKLNLVQLNFKAENPFFSDSINKKRILHSLNVFYTHIKMLTIGWRTINFKPFFDNWPLQKSRLKDRRPSVLLLCAATGLLVFSASFRFVFNLEDLRLFEGPRVERATFDCPLCFSAFFFFLCFFKVFLDQLAALHHERNCNLE